MIDPRLIIEYIVVSSTTRSAYEEKVNNLIREGWIPYNEGDLAKTWTMSLVKLKEPIYDTLA